MQLKQRLDEEFKTCRQAKTKELQDVQTRYDTVRQKHLALTQKKESINYNLQVAMKTLEERQEEIITLNEAKDEAQNKIDEDISKIVALRTQLTEGGDNMETLEQQIYELSVQNRNH